MDPHGTVSPGRVLRQIRIAGRPPDNREWVLDVPYESGIEDLRGITLGEDARAVAVRVAFTGAFLADERVRDLYKMWLKWITDFLAEHPSGPFQDFAAQIKINPVEGYGAIAELAKSLPPDINPARSAMYFVYGFGLSPWLAFELLNGFYWRVVSIFCPVSVVTTFTPAADSLAPEVRFEFATQAGETVDAAIVRLARETNSLRRKLLSAKKCSGYLPDRTVKSLERNAVWFYRFKVKGETIRAIARSDFDGDPERRKDVRRGVDQAEKLLAIAGPTLSELCCSPSP